jgi:hypothetical protein
MNESTRSEHLREPGHHRQPALPCRRPHADPKGKEGSPQERDLITTDQLVDIVMEALAEERFMISTHPFVLDKFAIKARDYEQYIRTMRADRAATAAAVPA